ncbi:hypothetical protein MNEG_9057 [Monoraphidium neglectum]|uniref:DUF1554 domain-containing protein n=1 Tax=Monoraphidium neglectum TaxID=145388 RepID=A0A0D2M630_9CHLO|nr:hypothetical protein MNEG_9057 [Monoraphidium neglectum]KIY98904.1 hypothetical protein MNEG_9057 [Monoraphidium neglectum]|eukprot:XP_013897924.1 hypothetical protein MNEG_9057 [Monoraphidium neglectum]
MDQLCSELLAPANATADSKDPTKLRYGCGVATAAQVNKVSSDLAALEPKVNAAAAQASSAQAAVMKDSNQFAALRAEMDALRVAVAALTGNPQGTQANTSNGTDPGIAQQIAALAAADARTAQKLALLEAANQTAAREIAALTAQVQELKAGAANATDPATIAREIAALKITLAATKSAQEADAAAISLTNATVEFVKSTVTSGAAAVASLNATLTALEATVANVTAIDFNNLNAVTLGGIPATRYMLVVPKLVLYRESDTTRNGNLGGRSGADALCKASVFKPAGAAQARAFLSISTTDQISDFPTLYKVPSNLAVESLSGVVLASNFATLLQGRIPKSLLDAGVFTGRANWWSGSDAFGMADVANCGGFTSASSTDIGVVGTSIATSASWAISTTFDCDTDADLLCIAF